MRSSAGLNNSVLLRDLDKILAIAGVIISLILIAYLGRENGRIVYLLTGVLTLISCLLWLAIRNSHIFEFHLPDSQTLIWFGTTCFFGLCTLSILILYLRPDLYERPIVFFILTALMAGIIGCEIFTSGKRHVGLILLQVVLLGVTIAWSQLLIFPGLVGVDPWYHSFFTGQILYGNVIPEGEPYSKLPLFHLMIAATSLIADTPYKFAAMISVSLGQILCNAVFIFILANYIFKNHRVGLVAALMVIIANHHINMSFWSIPNSFAAVFVPIAIYLLFFRFNSNIRSPFFLLCILALAPIILTHTITAMCMAILLFVSWGALTFYGCYFSRVENRISLWVPTIFTTAMLAWWTYATGHTETLMDLFRAGLSAEFFQRTPADLLVYATITPFAEQLFNYVGMFLFFTFSFIGIFYMVSRRRSSSSFAIAWVSMAPLAISFFSLISGHSVIEDRWYYFAQILLSVPLAVAIYYGVGIWKSKRSLCFYSVVFGFMVVFSFLMIMSPAANVDNLYFSPNSHVRYSLTEAELELITTTTNISNDPIKTDEYYAGSQKWQYPQVSAFCEQIYSNNFSTLNHHLILIRDSTVHKPFKIFSSTYKLDYDLNDALDGLGFSQIYDSNAGSGYRCITG